MGIRAILLAVFMGCQPGPDGVRSIVGGDTSPIPACYFHGALAFVNHAATTSEALKYAGVHSRAASSIEHAKSGPDKVLGTEDDVTFSSLDEVDALSYVGPAAIDALLGHAALECEPALRLDGEACHEYEAIQLASLSWLDGPALRALGVPAASSNHLIAHRNGQDGIPDTSDDVTFISMKHIDDVHGVGAKSLDALLAAGAKVCGGTESVVFSPQQYDESHLSRVEEAVDNAKHSIDVAMYSFRDATIFKALERAVARGIRVRVMYEAASAHRKDPEGTMSADLEDIGIEVRWVNKIMHHKFAIIDGPQQQTRVPDSFQLISGSGNWSYSAATRYDENTLFFRNDDRLALAFQAEFNLLWENGRPVIWNEDITTIPHVSIDERDITTASGSDVFFTSENFRAYHSNTYGPTFTLDGTPDAVVSEVVSLIQSAESSIRIASGHMRSRPILDAIVAKRDSNPSINVQVYLDGQEFISEWYYDQQVEDLEECLRDAGTDSDDLTECMAKGYYFSYDLVEAGIQTRFKFYSYRWHYSYAEQMHHKYLLVDDRYLLTGSYNFSNNAEENTFENMILIDASDDPITVGAYRRNHESMWQLNRSSLEPLVHSIIEDSDDIPLVFDSMALDWNEVSRVKNAIREECAKINDAAFREQPEKHKWCPRD